MMEKLRNSADVKLKKDTKNIKNQCFSQVSQKFSSSSQIQRNADAK